MGKKLAYEDIVKTMSTTSQTAAELAHQTGLTSHEVASWCYKDRRIDKYVDHLVRHFVEVNEKGVPVENGRTLHLTEERTFYSRKI